MLQITKKADYAVRLMFEVGAHPGGAITTAEVAKRQEIPYQFLRKVAQMLVARGLLVSERGGKGGLRLARPPEAISVLDILQALDLPPLNDCSTNPNNCKRRAICAAFPVWYEAQLEVDRVLGGTPLSKLIRTHRALEARTTVLQTGQTAHERDAEDLIQAGRKAHEKGTGNRLESVSKRPS